jgi:ATP-binding cassette subfamily B protein/subfamily B ATP-binding cassette protein MsbA
MIKKIKNIKNNPLFTYITGEKHQNTFQLIITLFPGILAGLMEGISYGFLLLSVNVLRGETIASLPFFGFLMKIVRHLSPNRQFLFFIITALFIQIIRSSFLFLSQYIVSRLSLKISTLMQCKIYKEIFNYSFPFVNKYAAGDLISYNSSPLVIPSMLLQYNNAFCSLALGIISLGYLIRIDPILTIFLIFFFFIINRLYSLILKKVSKISTNLTNEEIQFSSQANQNINGIKLIHMFFRQNYIVEKTQLILKKIAASNNQLIFWRTLIQSFGEIIGIIVIALMLISGALLLRHRTSFISSLLMFIFIAYRFSMRLQIFMTSIGEVIAAKGPLLRLSKILDERNKEYISNSGTDLKDFTKHITLKNVTFFYNDRRKSSLEDFSFTFEKGKTYAIIGKSGAGKSTLVDLILNLYSPSIGKIIVDDIPLDKISLQSWRSKIGIVNQDIFLFHSSIEDNIKFGNNSATTKNITKVAKMAYAHDFVSKLPQQYQTIIGEKGHKLSGGERQRIALARALIKNPDILILDEATSQLDSHSEKLIQQAINNLRKEKTIIIIAHRLSTITDADKILVINKGKLIEIGSHDELMEKQGQYSYLWNIQSKKENSHKMQYI